MAGSRRSARTCTRARRRDASTAPASSSSPGSSTRTSTWATRPPSLNGRLEIDNWARAGAPLALILRAATIDNARALGLSRELGTIEVGKRADLLLLQSNPLSSVNAYDSIETIFLNGEPIARDSLRARR